MIRIRPALPAEHGPLEDLQRRASLVAEEFREDLLAHPDAIALDLAEIAAGRVLVAEGPAGELLGFAAWLPLGAREAELDGLFVEPDRWRGGIGSRLIEAAARAATSAGAARLRVAAGPAEVPFYARRGFVAEGETQTRFGPAAVMVMMLRR